ncbi:VgrG-related protein [Streptomyces sp. NPDC051555]|uniref:VgrG-related protein n=1 Tax=Streptomyces sp. NPDC051555 TaxID=3365657 RepID=UPI0037962CEF
MTGRHTAGVEILVDKKTILPKIANVLAWVSVEEDGRTSAKAEIGFRDPRNASLFKESGIKLGSRIEVKAITAAGPVPIFVGEVTECEAKASVDTAGASGHTGGVMTVVRARDLSHRLRLGRRTVAYEGMTAGEIVKKVAKLAEVNPPDVEDTKFPYEYLSQPGMSDWDFLSHLARENGRDLYFREGKLHFKRRVAAEDGPGVVLHFGDNLISVRTAASLAHQVPKVEVRGWDREKKAPVTSEKKTAKGGAWGKQSASSSSHYAPMVLAGLPRSKSDEVAAVAESMAQEVEGGLMRLHAVVRGEPTLRLRSVVKLKGLGTQFEGQFTVTKVRHHFHPVQGYRTELTVDEGTDRAVVGQPGNAEEGLRRIPGFVRGKVTNIKDPKKLGRVRVKLDCLDAKYETTWAETAQLGGSRGHGVVLPEVGDVVAVVFEQGCLDSPLVVCGIDDTPIQHSMKIIDEGKGQTNLRSFASKGGHRLELIDKDGAGMGVNLSTGDGKLYLRMDGHEKSGGTVSISSDGKIKITGKGDVTVDAGAGDLLLKGKKVTINATEGEARLTGRTVSVEGLMDLTAKGGSSSLALKPEGATLKGAPMVNIKGSPLVNIN